MKLQFTLDAVGGPDPFDGEVALNEDVREAIQWMAERTGSQVMAERESIIQRIEMRADELWRSGACGAWLETASPDTGQA